MMSMYAANNIATAVRQFQSRDYATLGGIILNAKNIVDEKTLVNKLCEEISTEIVQYIPRNPVVQEAEHKGQTVVEAFPEDEMTQVYLSLAEKIIKGCKNEV